MGYVLPTESQWEYACRAGTKTVYSWGDTISSDNANYGNIIGQTSNVGNYVANPWGFYDMHGNVWEWTADAYQDSYPTGNPVVNPSNVGSSASDRVLRSGAWGAAVRHLRSAKRGKQPPNFKHNKNIGFRLSLQKNQ